MTTVEPPQVAEKSVIIREATQPFYIEGYHRPTTSTPTTRLRRHLRHLLQRPHRPPLSLPRPDQSIAAEAQGFSGFPRQVPRPLRRLRRPTPWPHADEMRAAIHKELDRLKNEDVTDAELERF